jgi:hypothetical protein
MKSKLTMLIFAGALTLGVTAQNAMASGGLGNTPPARAVGSRKIAASAGNKRAVTKKVSSRAAVPPHTILNGAKNNVF